MDEHFSICRFYRTWKNKRRNKSQATEIAQNVWWHFQNHIMKAYWMDPVNEGRDSGEDSGLSHLVTHASWTITDNTMDSPSSIGVTVQGTSRIALGQVGIRADTRSPVWRPGNNKWDITSHNISIFYHQKQTLPFIRVKQDALHLKWNPKNCPALGRCTHMFTVPDNLIRLHPLQHTPWFSEQCCPTS